MVISLLIDRKNNININIYMHKVLVLQNVLFAILKILNVSYLSFRTFFRRPAAKNRSQEKQTKRPEQQSSSPQETTAEHLISHLYYQTTHMHHC